MFSDAFLRSEEGRSGVLVGHGGVDAVVLHDAAHVVGGVGAFSSLQALTPAVSSGVAPVVADVEGLHAASVVLAEFLLLLHQGLE